MEKRKSSIITVSHDAPAVSARFIYGSTTTHDGIATIHHGGATNAHDASTIRYGARTIIPSISQDNAPCNSSLKYSRVIHIGALYRF